MRQITRQSQGQRALRKIEPTGFFTGFGDRVGHGVGTMACGSRKIFRAAVVGCKSRILADYKRMQGIGWLGWFSDGLCVSGGRLKMFVRKNRYCREIPRFEMDRPDITIYPDKPIMGWSPLSKYPVHTVDRRCKNIGLPKPEFRLYHETGIRQSGWFLAGMFRLYRWKTENCPSHRHRA